MKTNKIIPLLFLCAGWSLGVQAQEGMKENPRGVYKFIDFVGRGGKTFEADEDRYKICTDSVTLTLIVKDGKFQFHPSVVLNYTGEESDEYEPHALRIYNSNEKQFTERWWSAGLANRALIPSNDWCIEHYEAGRFSDAGKAIIDAFMSANYKDGLNPLIGIWEPIGSVNDPRNAEDLKKMRIEASATYNSESAYCILTPMMFLNCRGGKGTCIPITLNDKDSFLMKEQQRQVLWLTPDSIAVSLQQGYTVWARAKRETSLLSAIATPVAGTSSKIDPFIKESDVYLSNVPDVLDILYMPFMTLGEKFEKLGKSWKVHGMLVPSSIAKNLSRRYVIAQYKKDLSKVFAEYARKNSSLDYLRGVNTMYKTPQVQQAKNNYAKMKLYVWSTVFPGIINDFVSSKGAIPTVEIRDCSTSYQRTFEEFCHVTNIQGVMNRRVDVMIDGGIDGVMLKKIEQILPMTADSIKNSEKMLKKVRKILPTLSNSIEANMSVILRNACLDYMTEEDMKVLIAVATSPEGKATKEMDNAFVKIMDGLFAKDTNNEEVLMVQDCYRRWLEVNTHVTYKTVTYYTHSYRPRY